MQFTPQQLAGAQRYGTRTRIGNWYEDLSIAEARKADCKKQTSALKKFKAKIAFCTKTLDLSKNNSASVFKRNGDCVALFHKSHSGLLACNPFDKDNNVSLCASNEAVLRCMFTVVTLEHGFDSNDQNNQIIRWGIPFQLTTCLTCSTVEKTTNEEHIKGNRGNFLEPSSQSFLASCMRTGVFYSPVSHRQEVFFTLDKESYDTHWVAQVPATDKSSGYTRFVNKGHPILPGEQFVLQHCATKSVLTSSSKHTLATDFGTELEVCCSHDVHRNGRVLVLKEEFNGTRTQQTTCQLDLNENIWVFGESIASSKSTIGSIISIPKMLPAHVFKRIAFSLKNQGILSLRLLRCQLLSSILITSSNPKIEETQNMDLPKLKQVFDESQIYLAEEHWFILFQGLSWPSPNGVNINDFFSVLCQESFTAPTEESETLINQYFQSVDEDSKGFVCSYTIENRCMKLSDNGFRKKFRITEKFRYCEFISLFNGRDCRFIFKEEFVDFFKDILVEMNDGLVFNEFMNELWTKSMP